MKARLFTLIIFACHIASAQLTIKPKINSYEIGSFSYGRHMATLKCIPSDSLSDTTFVLLYHNQEYQTIYDTKSISFKESKTVNELYDLLSTFFIQGNAGNKEYRQNFVLGDKNIMAMGAKEYDGKPCIIIAPKGGGYFSINEDQLKKLFGK